jgi:CubicO group peptidase (beta-lactamase class C family)
MSVTATSARIEGLADPRFAELRDAFATCFADGIEHGAAVAVTLDGKLVADLWGGHADIARAKPWQRNTLVNVWSVSKAVLAVAVAMQVERGKLSYDAPIATVWPEFAANGKDKITLDLAMSHQAGLNGLSVPMDLPGLYAWDPFAEALAAMAPLWEPDSRNVYHPITYGTLAGEPLRRVAGCSVGQFIAREISGPLGAEFYVGLGAQHEPQVAEIVTTSSVTADSPDRPYPQGSRNPVIRPDAPNSRDWRAAEIPGANGHATARGLASILGGIAAGTSSLLSPAGRAAMTRERFRGIDSGDNRAVGYGAGMRISDRKNFGPRPGSGVFGHPGWGGSLAFGDSDAKLGFAFVTNRMEEFGEDPDPRRLRLIDAVYDCL